MRNLDPKFFEIRITRHAISDISVYGDYIDRAMLTFYTKSDTATLVLDILQEEDIEMKSLMDLMNGMHDLLHSINRELNLGEDLSGNVIKLNLQSKGLLAVVSKGIKSLAILGLILTFEACGTVDAEKAREVGITEDTVKILHATLNQEAKGVDTTLLNMQADRGKLARTFSE